MSPRGACALRRKWARVRTVGAAGGLTGSCETPGQASRSTRVRSTRVTDPNGPLFKKVTKLGHYPKLGYPLPPPLSELGKPYNRCLTSDVCRPVVPNVIRRFGEFKFTVTCFHSTLSQPMSEFHSCFCGAWRIVTVASEILLAKCVTDLISIITRLKCSCRFLFYFLY